VGPRPCLPAEYAEYKPWQRRRFLAVPGLTGLWQVSGKNRTTFEEMVRLDIRYIETKSCGLDLSIILATVPSLLEQIYEAKAARKTASAGAYHPTRTFPMQAAPVQLSTSALPSRAPSTLSRI